MTGHPHGCVPGTPPASCTPDNRCPAHQVGIDLEPVFRWPLAVHEQTEHEAACAYADGKRDGYREATEQMTRDINAAVGTDLPDFASVIRWLVRTDRRG
ncbi:hypothetical protein [Phytohabitans aurantiacus]|uniref:Uncharacterized protein n=1 Tax=Phytohabitans aurantiacus TaxID=3016789 RepID=A0ABQ5R295_9ACTN|nr:hypothetical protein [Phytohabitans aurantiacus]GLI00322.1 hypothetical protein Pa4123_55980 [Phytohabitans aurantiacus]